MNIQVGYAGMLRNAAEETRTLDRGEQIIRSVYNVYLRKNRLVYIREQCSESEESSRFLLHTFPLNPDDRPGRLHDTLDFDFVEFGWQGENQCLAIRDLPSYDIGRIRTGQTSVSRTTHDWTSNYDTEPYKDRLLEEAASPCFVPDMRSIAMSTRCYTSRSLAVKLTHTHAFSYTWYRSI